VIGNFIHIIVVNGLNGPYALIHYCR